MAGAFPAVPGQAQPGQATPGVPFPAAFPLPPVPAPTVTISPGPSIPDPIAGFGYQQDDFAELWTQPAAFFQQRVVFRASQTGSSTTLPSSGAQTTIIYDNILEDPYAGYNAVNGRWAAPFSGWYQATVTVWVAAPGATNVVLQPYVSTVKNPGNAANGKPLTAVLIPNDVAGADGTWTVYLAAGDVVYGVADVKNSGSNVSTNLTAGQNSTLEILWLS